MDDDDLQREIDELVESAESWLDELGCFSIKAEHIDRLNGYAASRGRHRAPRRSRPGAPVHSRARKDQDQILRFLIEMSAREKIAKRILEDGEALPRAEPATVGDLERSRQKHPYSLPGAYDLYLRALPFMTFVQLGDARTAAVFLTDALKIDPNYIAARARLAHCHEIFFRRDVLWRVPTRPPRSGMRACRDREATPMTRRRWPSPLWSSPCCIDVRERGAALSAIERALALNPSLRHGASILARPCTASPPAPVEADRRRQPRGAASPFGPRNLSAAHLALGLAAIVEARYDEAASHCAKACRPILDLGNLLFSFMAASPALTGRLDEATPVARRYMEMVPSARIALCSPRFGFASALTDKLIEGVRLLGLP